LPEPVIEHELIARKGRTRTKLVLRVFAPVAAGRDFACSFELRAGREVLWPLARLSYGVDSLQSLMLALRLAALHLLYFEMDTGMRIDAWQWVDLVDLVGDSPISTYARDRVNELKAEIRALTRKHSDAERRTRAPRAASANRKRRTANRKPSTGRG
jgi:hypothetical protein